MPLERGDSRPWYESPWKLGFVVCVALSLARCAWSSSAPENLFGAEVAPADSTITECGIVTRTSRFADTTLTRYEYKDGRTAPHVLRILEGMDIEVDKKYEFTFLHRSYIVTLAKEVRKCG
ncbi:hypothetical protein KW796_00270 [Candidatus Parcubacteria bacterium]|nr:hypothetical protein [Candidatus Parcubacteria bacterium]